MNWRMFQRVYPFAFAGVAVLILLGSIGSLIQWNNDETYQVIEYPNGEYSIIDSAGFHGQWFGEVFTYPRYVDAYFSAATDEGTKDDTSIRVTFNDGGWGFTSNHLRFQMPNTTSERIALHRHFGRGGKDEVTAAIQHHLMNCLKNAGPLMSASEHQAQRKSEFYQVVLEQLQNGLYVMDRMEQKVERGLDRPLGDEAEVVYFTKIRRDPEGNPVIAASSPLKEYGITVIQYNQTGTTYDADTNAQISAKRESYQQAEQAKAATINEQQKLLEVIQKGKLAVAGVEAEENVKKKQALVLAQQEQDVARIEQAEAVTKAEQTVAVAGEDLKTVKTKLDISAIKVEQAKAEAAKLLAESQAMQAKLQRAGALSEKDQVLAELRQRRSALIAEAIAKIPSPKTLILSSGNGQAGNTGEAGTTQTLMNLFMLRMLDPSANPTVQK